MDKTFGQIGYEAYGAAAGWKTFDGRPMPSWKDLGETPVGLETRRRWEVAAEAIVEADALEAIDAPAPSTRPKG